MPSPGEVTSGLCPRSCEAACAGFSREQWEDILLSASAHHASVVTSQERGFPSLNEREMCWAALEITETLALRLNDKICGSLTTVCHSALAEAADNFPTQFCVVNDCHFL